MSKKTIFFVVSFFLAIAFVGLRGQVDAAAPWENLVTVNKVEADPNKDYILKESDGPWLIMTTSFSGEGAEEQARELVLELRSKYKVPAYMHRRKFDFAGEVRGRGIDKFGQPLKMKYRTGESIDEIAVLVGHFDEAGSPDAQEVLQKLKNSRPECLDVRKRKQTNQSLAQWRHLQRQFKKAINSKKTLKGPLGHAFVTTNPLLPPEYFVPKGVDPFVASMNEGVKHSLLDCRGKYSVQVAIFKGKSILDQKKIQEELKKGRKTSESKLAEAAQQAHRLTEALRIKGYDAYEFHDRYCSIVTVGSFTTVGTPRSDGRTEINPSVLAVIETFKAAPQNKAGMPGGALVPKTLDGIPFDIQPIPVEVPRRSLSTAFNKPSEKSLW